MTQDEIIEMAEQVYGECVWHESALLRLEAFVKLVAAKAIAELESQGKTMKVEGPLHVVCQCDKCKTESQEPMAWMDGNGNLFPFVWNVGIQQGSKYLDETLTPLYTHPLQRTWVGLTDYEIGVCSTEAAMNRSGMVGGAVTFARAIEAKLREKNSPHKEKNT
jgi:hypothetical protein